MPNLLRIGKSFALDTIATEVQRTPQPSRRNHRERQPEWL